MNEAFEEIERSITKQPLELRNKSTLGTRPVTISMPEELLLAIDSRIEKNQRSAYICNVLRKHLGRETEQDPRFLVLTKEQEIKEFDRLAEQNRVGLKQKLHEYDRRVRGKRDKLQRELNELQRQAEQKMQELLE